MKNFKSGPKTTTRSTLLAATILMALGPLPLAAHAQDSKAPSAQTGTATTTPAPTTAQPPKSDETQQHFAAALDAFARKNYRAAATEVRQAEAYVRREATHATGATKNALENAGADLERAAKALEKDGIKAEKRMRKAFDKAKHALTMNSKSKASPFDAGA